MTEKKFTLLEDTNGGLDTVLETMVKDNGKFLTHKEYCDLLNEQHEENIRLKRDFDSCSHNWALMYDEAKEKVEALTKENWELEQENQKLKKLNIPIDEIKDTVSDYRGRIIGVYYND